MDQLTKVNGTTAAAAAVPAPKQKRSEIISLSSDEDEIAEIKVVIKDKNTAIQIKKKHKCKWKICLPFAIYEFTICSDILVVSLIVNEFVRKINLNYLISLKLVLSKPISSNFINSKYELIQKRTYTKESNSSSNNNFRLNVAYGAAALTLFGGLV